MMMMIMRESEEDSGGGGEGGNGGKGGSSSSSTRCQECGNQAKKDCVYLRCRTCCKTRGFQCETHVKSTWVPVSKRRQKHHQHTGIQHHHQQLFGLNLSSKRFREDPSFLGEFPGEVRLAATFNCVRVSSIDKEVNQYAYQTSVDIGGHRFKGILYDQGPEMPPTEISSGGGTAVHQQQPNATGTGGGPISGGGGATSPPSSYPSPYCAFLPGMPFFQYPKS